MIVAVLSSVILFEQERDEIIGCVLTHRCCLHRQHLKASQTHAPEAKALAKLSCLLQLRFSIRAVSC